MSSNACTVGALVVKTVNNGGTYHVRGLTADHCGNVLRQDPGMGSRRTIAALALRGLYEVHRS